MKKSTRRRNRKESTYEKSLKNPELMKYIRNKKDSSIKRGKIILKFKAYKRIVGYTIRYANNDIKADEWREGYGILIGTVNKQKDVIIKDAIPMVVGERAGVKYEDKQYVDMAQIDSAIYEKAIHDKTEDFIIGWFHSHPGFGFFYSPIDCLTQLGYQIPNPHAVGIIFDHTKKSKKDLGIAALGLKNPQAGFRTDYEILDLEFELSKDEMLKKIDLKLKRFNKKVNSVKETLNYIDDVLINKGMRNLQENFGLIPIQREDIEIIDDREEAKTTESKIYRWDVDAIEQNYTFPEFRKNLEETIRNYEEELYQLKLESDIKEFDKHKVKYQRSILATLDKPKELYNKILEDFHQSLGKISNMYDFLDTNERKKIEYLEEKLSIYEESLSSFTEKATFSTI